ncbi:Deoxycytidine monophosphate (dCMP) deaminase [Mycoemilia scoparia]|uniref:Deoxycytidylate deaminase n=1 Tax=Mycoemilia scoparia TaxID=417184 RepID=A0A9W8A9M0_9FUNG|nr:Deoxycytidine monophosphate (dCMP) deaminase [Mycoemilia scoparia]
MFIAVIGKLRKPNIAKTGDILIGSSASGRQEVVNYLVKHEGFTEVFIGDSLLNGHHSDEEDKVKTCHKNSDELLKYVTPRWRENFVTRDLCNTDSLYQFKKRPFFLLVAIHAPIKLRYQRRKLKCMSMGVGPPSFEEFIDNDDADTFGPYLNPSKSPKPGFKNVNFKELAKSSPASPPRTLPLPTFTLQDLISMSDVYVCNAFIDLDALYGYLKSLNLTDLERLRPSWDTYFMLLAELAAHRSNCMKRRVGCILVRDNQIIATGYNGTPKGILNCNEGGCPRCNDGTPCGVSLDHCLCIHAEENALLEAGRGRVGIGGACTLYCNTCPCLGCAKKIVQVGVKEVVYSNAYGMDDLTAKLFKEANITMRQHTQPKLKLGIQSL